MQNSGNSQKTNMADVRRVRHQLERRGGHVPGMPRNSPWLVAFLGIFVFFPLIVFGGAYLGGVLTGNWAAWNFLMLAISKLLGN